MNTSNIKRLRQEIFAPGRDVGNRIWPVVSQNLRQVLIRTRSPIQFETRDVVQNNTNTMTLPPTFSQCFAEVASRARFGQSPVCETLLEVAAQIKKMNRKTPPKFHCKKKSAQLRIKVLIPHSQGQPGGTLLIDLNNQSNIKLNHFNPASHIFQLSRHVMSRTPELPELIGWL